MRKLIMATCLLIIALSTNAAEINFLENPTWSTVLEKAKKENKLIFFDAFASWCGPCKKMDAETYKDQAVADFFNANFINVKYDMEKGEGPMLSGRYAVQAYPNLLFIDANGVLVHKGIGFLESAEFMDLGKTAKNPSTQFYTLKKNALQLNNVDFVKFAKQGRDMEDEDMDLLVSDYLAKQADVLGNPELITLIMEYTNTLPDEKTLAYIINNKDKILKSNLYKAEDLESRFIGLTVSYAISDHVQGGGDDFDFEALKTLVEKYVPERAFFVINYFKLQYAVDRKENDKVMESMNLILDNYPAKVTLDQVCNALMNVAPGIEDKAALTAILGKFDAIKVQAKDADKAYMKGFVKAVIYLKTKDNENFKKVANEMLASKDTPEKMKEDLKGALEAIK